MKRGKLKSLNLALKGCKWFKVICTKDVIVIHTFVKQDQAYGTPSNNESCLPDFNVSS